ncbi:MAG: hypothetical protein ACI9SY_000576 [Candidatus Paceibacteria bacterium]|jgi:hypothetical protein
MSYGVTEEESQMSRIFYTATAICFGLATPAFSQSLPGDHTEFCRAEIMDLGGGTYAVYDGDWSGLEQTVVINTELFDGVARQDVIILAATPGKPEWNVPQGCVEYIGAFDGTTFTATSGQSSDEQVTYVVTTSTVTGELTAPGIYNTARMNRANQNVLIN